jgi:hypothetical protein
MQSATDLASEKSRGAEAQLDVATIIRPAALTDLKSAVGKLETSPAFCIEPCARGEAGSALGAELSRQTASPWIRKWAQLFHLIPLQVLEFLMK